MCFPKSIYIFSPFTRNSFKIVKAVEYVDVYVPLSTSVIGIMEISINF